MKFPVTQIFNFLENPDSVLEYAKGLSYSNENGKYPGLRSDPLHEINPGLFRNLTDKVLQVWFDLKNNSIKEYNCHWSFQKITKNDIEGRDGWPHRDTKSALTIIVYLTKNNDNFGTSILLPKNPGDDDIFTDTNLNGPAMVKLGYSKDDIDKRYVELNNKFKVVSQFKSVYNSAIMFDGHYPHQANFGTLSEGEERITLIGFIYDLYTNDFPIPKMRSIII